MKEEKLLEILISESGYVSGEKIAKDLGVTRNCVWKNVRALKKEGYVIDTVPQKGYVFRNSGNNVSAAAVKRNLKKNIEIECVKTVGSTNTALKEKAEEKKERVLIADSQTCGKGRLGRSFFSPEKSGLYMSILIYPDLKAEDSHMITAAAAVAVCRAIEKVAPEKKPTVKWVNDVFLGGKKVCGILTEGSADLESGGLEYAIVGIGVNLYTSKKDFPNDLKSVAGSVFDEKPDPDMRNVFAATLIDEFFDIYESRSSDFMKEYVERSFLVGKRVISAVGEGRVKKITEKAGLVLEFDDGSERILTAGEVSVKEKI